MVIIRRKSDTDSIVLKTTLITRRLNAAQLKGNPSPVDTRIPRGVWAGWIVHELTSPALLMRTVQMTKQARTEILAMTAVEADTGSAQVCLTEKGPLGGTGQVSQSHRLVNGIVRT